jgi:hypothetical protein
VQPARCVVSIVEIGFSVSQLGGVGQQPVDFRMSNRHTLLVANQPFLPHASHPQSEPLATPADAPDKGWMRAGSLGFASAGAL